MLKKTSFYEFLKNLMRVYFEKFSFISKSNIFIIFIKSFLIEFEKSFCKINQHNMKDNILKKIRKNFITWNSSNFAITFSEWKWPNMFVLVHARWLVLHTPFSGKLKFIGGIDLACEQSMPIYELLHLHTPEK